MGSKESKINDGLSFAKEIATRHDDQRDTSRMGGKAESNDITKYDELVEAVNSGKYTSLELRDFADRISPGMGQCSSIWRMADAAASK